MESVLTAVKVLALIGAGVFVLALIISILGFIVLLRQIVESLELESPWAGGPLEQSRQ